MKELKKYLKTKVAINKIAPKNLIPEDAGDRKKYSRNHNSNQRIEQC